MAHVKREKWFRVSIFSPRLFTFGTRIMHVEAGTRVPVFRLRGCRDIAGVCPEGHRINQSALHRHGNFGEILHGCSNQSARSRLL